MEETPPPSKTSDKNSWPVTEDHSSSHDGSRGWPEWDAHESLKCKDSSEWPSWECSHGNKDIQKSESETMVTEVLTVAGPSFNEQRGRGRLRESSRDRGWNGSSKRHSELSKRNSWLVTKDYSRSRNGRSRRCPDWDALNSSECKDDSGWPSRECLQENKDTHNDDTVDREVHTVPKYTLDEQRRGQSKIRKRGRSRSRSRQREYSKSWSRSPHNGLTQASCRLIEKRTVSEMTSRRCRDFAAGKCFRGSHCRFLHQGYLKSRDRDHLRNKLTERSKFRADDRGALQFGNYKGSASGPCDKISDNCEDYCEEAESWKNAFCWKKLLDGKCFREESCRYSHHKSGGEEYDRRNERVIYDQNVKPLVNQNDIGQCKFFSVGRCHQNDCRFSHDVGRVTTGFLDAAKTKECDEDYSFDRPKAKLSGRGEDEIKSEKGSAWEKFAGVSEKPEDTTGWGKWPAKPDNYIGNSNSHDSQSKRWDGRSKDNIYSQDLSKVKKHIDNNILRNSVKKSGSERDKLMDLNTPVDREKAMGQGKDKTKSWNGPTCDKDCSLDRPKTELSGWEENTKKSENGLAWDRFAGASERPKDTTSRDIWPAWSDSSNKNPNSHNPQNKRRDDRSKGNIYSQDSIDAKKQADDNILYNSVKKSSERADPGRNEKFPEREEFLQSHLRNEAASNTNMDLKMLGDKEKAMGQKKDMTRLSNGPTWGDEGCYLDRPKETGRDGRTTGNRDPRVFAYIEKRNDGNVAHNFLQKDMTKSWNGPTWGEGYSINRPQATGKGDRAIGNRDPRICADVEERNDGNISCSFVQMGVQDSGSEWNKKVTVRDANRLSSLQNDYNGAGRSTIKVSDSVRLNDGKKSTNQGEDKKNSWNPSSDNSACSLDNTKASGWGGSRSSDDRHCQYPIEMTTNGQDNKVVGKDEYLPSHMLNGREDVDKDTSNLLASKKIFFRNENQIEAQGSEPGGFIFPPSSNLMGFSQSCHALSKNPSNGFNVILDESVKYKLSALVNQMQNQFEEALKILETWARQNSITTDQALRLSKLQAYLYLTSENGQQNIPGNTSGVHLKSNEVLEKLKMEYLESSATILKQQEPVGYTEVNQKTVMVEKVNRNNSKGEPCKKEEEIIQSVGVDAQCEAGESKQDEKSVWLFKNALVKLVKEILNPVWMEGQIKKEVHNSIVKKAVDKVISTEGVNIPRTQEHIEQYLSLSKPQISALINDYLVYFKRLADSS